MTDDPAQEERLERNSTIAAAVLFFSVLVPVIGLLAGWDEALDALELIGLLGAVGVLVEVLGRRLIEHLPLPASMTRNRAIRVALLIGWAIVYGLWSGWDLLLVVAATMATLLLIQWFYDNKTTGRPKQLMRAAGYLVGTAAILAFLAILATSR